MTDVSTEQDFFSASVALAQVEHLDVGAMELLFKVENSGEDFYNLLADRVGNEEAAVLLRRNGREESGHARRIGRAIAIKQGRPFEPSPEVLARFEIPLPAQVGPEIFPLIVQAELDGDIGYLRWADAEPDPEVATLLRRNAREESLHARRATQAAALLGGLG
jgi:rubrerythrin